MNDVQQKSKPIASEITLERNVPYPPEQVFKAWTDQEALRQWMGPGKICAPNATMEARVGGAYVFPMQRPDGTITTVRGGHQGARPQPQAAFYLGVGWRRQPG
jgi:uncharacterized protein YndB with AHSA1/START domain